MTKRKQKDLKKQRSNAALIIVGVIVILSNFIVKPLVFLLPVDCPAPANVTDWCPLEVSMRYEYSSMIIASLLLVIGIVIVVTGIMRYYLHANKK